MAEAIKKRPYAMDLENDWNALLAAMMVMKLFDARTGAHVQHLASHSYAEHKILQKFYEDIGDKADSIAEAMQGIYQELLPLDTTNPGKYNNGDPLSSMKVLREWMDANRDEVCDDEEVQALIDEAMIVIDSGLYKLKFLK